MNTKDLLAILAKNAGLEKNADMIAILEGDTPATIPEHLANILLAGNMSESAAQNNPNVKKHFQDIEKKFFFNMYDGEIKKNLIDLGLIDQEIKDVLQMEGHYGEKLKKAFELSKITHSKGKNDDERVKTINELSSKLKLKEDELANNYVPKELLENLQKAIETDKLNRVLGSKIAKINLAGHFEADREAISDVILRKISKKYLVELGENGNVKLKNLTDPSLDATDENKALLSFEDALAKESLLYTQKTPEQQKTSVTHVVDNTLLSGRDQNDRKATELEQKYADLLGK